MKLREHCQCPKDGNPCDCDTTPPAKEKANEPLPPTTGSEVRVMLIGPHPPKRATETAATMLRAYRESGIPNTAMSRFMELSTRTAFDVEDLFYALQAGLEAARWNPQNADVLPPSGETTNQD